MRKLMVVLSALWLVPFSAVAAGTGTVVEVQIKNMACPVCARAVGERISALPGVQDVKISLKTDTARVVMAAGQKPDVEAIKKAIATAGFEPGAATVQPKDQK